MNTRWKSVSLAVATLGVLTFSPARADFVIISNPGNADPLGGTYVSATHQISITAPEFSTVSSASDGTVTASFSSPTQVLSVATGSWGSWSSPPFSENANPTVLWTQGLATLTITFSKLVNTFGVELEPNQIGLATLPSLTETFYSGNTVVGSIVRSVDGDSGARLFAAVATKTTPSFTKVTLSNDSGDFGIAELRYATTAISVVPEPGTISMLVCSLPLLAGCALYHRKRRKA